MSDHEIARRCAQSMYANDDASKMLGISFEVDRAGSAVARLVVREDMLNGFDTCHGGLIFSLADTAFAFACNAYDKQTFAAQADIEFVRPARLGDELVAIAREDYRGSRTGFYTVEVRNQHDQLVAMFRGRSASTEEPIL